MKKIISEATLILSELGVQVQNKAVLRMLADNGAKVDLSQSQARFGKDMIDRALATSPKSFKLYDINGNVTNDFSGFNVHFTPGSAALHILDYQTKEIRKPTTTDYVDYVKIVSQLKHIDSHSTAFIPSDVH